MDTVVCPIDCYYKDYDGSLIRKIEEEYIFEENVVLNSEMFSLECLLFLHPDEIIITDGCDEWRENISINPIFYSENLVRCTDKLTYHCPFDMDDFDETNERAYYNMKYYVTVPGVIRADEIVVPSDAIREMIIKKLTEFAGKSTVWS